MEMPAVRPLTAVEAIEECLRIVTVSLPAHEGSTCCRALRGQISHEVMGLLRRERGGAKTAASEPVAGA